MSPPDVPVPRPPPWLDTSLLNALVRTANQSYAWGRDARAAAQDVRDLLIGLSPALPLTMIDEAVAWVVGDAEGLTAVPAASSGNEYPRPATRAEIAETLSYALRFDLTGRVRRTGHEHIAPLAAAQIAEHLLRSGFEINRRPPALPHSG